MNWRDVFGYARRAAHDKWLERGRSGDGRIEISDVVLDEAQVSGARLVAARFERCSFDRVAIEMSDLDEVEMINCRGSNGGLNRNRMYGARMTDCRFQEMRMWRLRFIDGHITRSSLISCILEEGFFTQSKIVDTRLCGSNLRFVGFDRARLVRCDLSGADLTGATAIGAHFEDCDLRGAVGVVLDGATYVNCQRD